MPVLYHGPHPVLIRSQFERKPTVFRCGENDPALRADPSIVVFRGELGGEIEFNGFRPLICGEDSRLNALGADAETERTVRGNRQKISAGEIGPEFGENARVEWRVTSGR
jgi:hypothetical protein